LLWYPSLLAKLTFQATFLACGLLAICPVASVCQSKAAYTQVVQKATPTVALYPTATAIMAGTSITLTATLTGPGATPSGSVSFVDGSTPLGTVTLNSSGLASYSTTSLTSGTHAISAQYLGDPNYNPAASTQIAVSVTGLASPMVAVSPASTSIAATQALNVSVSVSGGGGWPMPTGTMQLKCGSYTSAAATLVSGAYTFTIPAGSMVSGVWAATATYMPDAGSSSVYSPATNSAMVTVTGGASGFTLSGNSVTVTSGATSGNVSTITVTPQGGFTGTVTLTAALTSIASGLVSIPTFSLGNTTTVSITGTTPGQASLTFYTLASSASAQPGPTFPAGRWRTAGGVVMAGILILFIPLRRGRWRSTLGMILLLLIVAHGMTACIASNGRTTPGSYTVTVTGKSGTSTATCDVVLTVR